jgi:hypothetical protein
MCVRESRSHDFSRAVGVALSLSHLHRVSWPLKYAQTRSNSKRIGNNVLKYHWLLIVLRCCSPSTSFYPLKDLACEVACFSVRDRRGAVFSMHRSSSVLSIVGILNPTSISNLTYIFYLSFVLDLRLD